jgi:hypothetical protein
MASRGRKSAASLDVPAIGGAILAFRGGPRQPPVPLTPKQREVWRSVVDSPAGDMITPESEPLLVEYCRAAERADQLGAVMNSIEPDQLLTEGGFSRFERYMRASEANARTLANLSMKLRIAPSARVHKESAGTISARPRGSRPWEA